MTVLLTQLPSLLVDYAREDVLTATQASRSSAAGPFNLAGNPVFTVATDGAAAQLITMSAANFQVPAVATTAEVVAVLNASLVGSVAAVSGTGIVLRSLIYGTGSSINVTAGGANTALGFTTGLISGVNAAAQNVIINRVPEAGEVEVAVASAITFSVFNSSGTAPLANTFGATVAGVPAVVAGVYQAGFSGSVVLTDAATRTCVITPAVAFASASIIDVAVTISAVPLASYSFTSLDTTQPQVASAVAQDIDVVRLTFNEPMDPVGVALPGTYTFARLSTFAVAVVPLSVVVVDASTVDVATNIPLTFGANYKVTVGSAAKDIRGNAMGGAPNNSALFAGYNPEVPAGRRFQLWDWIPEHNKQEDTTRDLITLVSVLQEPTNLLLHEVDKMQHLLDPDTAPAEVVVDAMLADLGNPFDVTLELADKRRLLRVLVEIYQSKGTAAGIVAVVNFLLGLAVDVTTSVGTGWLLGVDTLDDASYLGPSEPRDLYTFDVTSAVTLTAAQRSRLIDIANYMRGAHEHLGRVVEPATPVAVLVADHVELGLSRLGIDWLLH